VRIITLYDSSSPRPYEAEAHFTASYSSNALKDTCRR
jgi:hypothetical protein